MALTRSPAGELGWTAADFELPDLDGTLKRLASVRGANGTVIAFICNHCPYVKAVIDDFVADAEALKANGIGVAAIMPNDYRAYPDDAPDKMAAFARRHRFGFPYLLDESQRTAEAYGAVCTPDIYGFDANDRLVYRGRLSEGGKNAKPGTRRELVEAMRTLIETGQPPAAQFPSMGCSIKWRPGHGRA